MNWKNSFREGKELILSTSSKGGVPNSNIVISLGFIGNTLLVADCQMKTTIKNLIDNNAICAVGGYFRIKGNVKIFSSGKYFNICVRKSKGYTVRHAILIHIKEIFDLNNVRVVK
ncbi:MAG: hypothetical protein ACP5NW_04470 [Candidatus Woesearchaeota archaeon]